ncbi:hypothetical protein DRN34_03810 [Thermococci archaeon]|nr:MAG: hypothetical protein DRN34_03810 [Thermococci archaeon]
MATFAFENSPQDSPPSAEMVTKKWVCEHCDWVQKIKIPVGRTINIVCLQCGRTNTLETSVSVVGTVSVAKKRYAHLESRLKVRKRWKCKACKLKQEGMFLANTTDEIECNRCGQLNRIVVAADENYWEPSKSVVKRITCDECGFEHSYLDTPPTQCGGCGTEMRRQRPAVTGITSGRITSAASNPASRPRLDQYRTTCNACGYIHAHNGAQPERCHRCEEYLIANSKTVKIQSRPSPYENNGRYGAGGKPIKSPGKKKKMTYRHTAALGVYNPNKRYKTDGSDSAQIKKETATCQECGHSTAFHPFFAGPTRCEECGSDNISKPTVKRKVSNTKAGKCESIW